MECLFRYFSTPHPQAKVVLVLTLNYGQGKVNNTKHQNKQEEQMFRQLTFKCKSTKTAYVGHTKHTVLDLFNVCSNHALSNYSGQ